VDPGRSWGLARGHLLVIADANPNLVSFVLEISPCRSPFCRAAILMRKIPWIKGTLSLSTVRWRNVISQVKARSAKGLPFKAGTVLGIARSLEWFSIFGSSVGLYGTLASSVRQRSREIGICMTLGAQIADILRLVAEQGVKILSIGLLVGILGAVAGAQLIQGLL
jgi:hypothetical protein